MARALKMNDKKHKWQYGKPPVYFNFPVSMFKQLTGEHLDVRQFKAMAGEIIHYGIADWYRRECSAWHDPQEYDAALFSQVLVKVGISVNIDKRVYFREEVGPMMSKVITSAGQPFCGINKDWLFSFRDDDKSDNECLQFLAYCAIRSILGSAWADIMPKPKRITWGHMLSRMAGNAKRVPVDELPPFIAAYNKRRNRDKLRKSLISKWHVQVDGQSRGPGGAYYMLHQSMPIAEAIENQKKCKELKRARAAGQAETLQPP